MGEPESELPPLLEENLKNQETTITMNPSKNNSIASYTDDDDLPDDISLSSTSADYYTLRRTDSSSSVPFIDLSRLTFLPDFDFGRGLELGDSTKKRFNDMKLKTQKTFKKFKDDRRIIDTNADILKLQDTLNARLAKFDQRVHRNLQSSATEKLFYALAVFLIAAAGFVIGKYPQWFHVFYTGLFCVLMPIRFYTYFKMSFLYYLADLCYYVNLLLVAFIWWFPNSMTLFISVFSLAMGTLSFAVITWRNSLVLHLIEKTTSSFIHIMPPIALFVIVHEVPFEYRALRFPGAAAIDHWNFINGILWTSFYYTVWQVSYHYFITIRRREKIAKGKVTSFTYLKNKNSSTILGRFVNSLPYTWMQVTAFTLIQYFYQILTMAPVPIWFKYKHACGTFMAFIFVMASYNGATYYIDVFGKRFEKEVKKLKKEVEDLQLKKDQVQQATVQAEATEQAKQAVDQATASGVEVEHIKP